MSADSFVCFIGLAVAISEHEIETIERNTHPLLQQARSLKVDTYFGNFATDGGEDYLLLVGKKLGTFGAENQARASFDPVAISSAAARLVEPLGQMGLSGAPQLVIAWEPDL